MIEILRGNALSIPLPDRSVQCVVTSPPYWGLRDYSADGQLGLEKTPEEYVANMVQVFREVWRVLRDDGTLWLNLGDSYASAPTVAVGNHVGLNGGKETQRHMEGLRRPNKVVNGLKPKDMVGIPWLVAKALQAPFYSGRIKSEVDRVWMAATIDGEGTICGFDHLRKDDGRHRTGASIFITNTATPMLDHAQSIWPASRHEHCTPGEGHLGTLETFRWIVNGIDNKQLFLREIYPYLIVKKQQALLAYNLLLFMETAKHDGKTAQHNEILEKRALLTRLMSDDTRAFDVPSWCKEPPSLYEPGWYLRSDIIWHKPNPMPESVQDRPTKAHDHLFLLAKAERYYYDAEAIREPCSESTHNRISQDLINQIGSARANGGKKTNGNIKAVVRGSTSLLKAGVNPKAIGRQFQTRQNESFSNACCLPVVTRNKRDVWTIPTGSYSGAHFATFPPALVEPCVLAGTSGRGQCPACGSPYYRVLEADAARASQLGKSYHDHSNDLDQGMSQEKKMPQPLGGYVTTGWVPSCECGAGEPVPQIVLDPFAGTGTVGQVAALHRRHFVGIELSGSYVDLARDRLSVLPITLPGVSL